MNTDAASVLFAMLRYCDMLLTIDGEGHGTLTRNEGN